MLAAASALWDAETGERLRSLEPLQGENACLPPPTFSADLGTFIVLREERKGAVVKLFDARREVLLKSVALGRRCFDLSYVSLSADGRLLAFAYWKPDVSQDVMEVWDLGVGAKLATLPVQGCGGRGPFLFSPDASRLALWECNGHSYVWDVAKRAFLPGAPEGYPLAFSEDGKELLTVDYGKPGVYLWNVASGRLDRKISVPVRSGTVGVNAALTQTAFDVGGSLEIWNLHTQTRVAALPKLQPLAFDMALEATFRDEHGYSVSGTLTTPGGGAFTLRGTVDGGTEQRFVPAHYEAPSGLRADILNEQGAVRWTLDLTLEGDRYRGQLYGLVGEPTRSFVLARSP